MSTNETPLELQNRLRAQQDHVRSQQDAHAQAEQERLNRQSTYVAPLDLADMDPVELESHRAGLRKDEATREATHAEAALRDRIRRAFVSSGGKEEEFEAEYPGLRKRYVSAETLNALQGTTESRADAPGSVRR